MKTTDLLKNHRTTRHFVSGHTIPANALQTILDASRQAASSMNGQHYSIIVITDPQLKQQLVDWSPRNQHIGTSAVYLLYCLDLTHMALASQKHGKDFIIRDNPDVLMTASVDTALAMQNAVVAAESLGYGTVYCGGMRFIADKLIDTFQLPQYVYPMCGLSIGVIDTSLPVEKIKPRFEEKVKVGYNTYPSVTMADIDAYDQVMADFAEARETKQWSEKFADFYAAHPYTQTETLLKKQGF